MLRLGILVTREPVCKPVSEHSSRYTSVMQWHGRLFACISHFITFLAVVERCTRSRFSAFITFGWPLLSICRGRLRLAAAADDRTAG